MPENTKPSTKSADGKPTTSSDDVHQNSNNDAKNKSANQNQAFDDEDDSDVTLLFTHDEANYFLHIYDDVISTHTRPEVVKKLYRCCQFLILENPSAIQLLPSCQENKVTAVDAVDISYQTLPIKTGTINNKMCIFCNISAVRNNSVANEILNVDSEDLRVKLFTAHLVSSELERFPDLLSNLLLNSHCDIFIRQMTLLILEILLATRGLNSTTDLANTRLPLGDTPIILAARSRDYDVMLLLLRHGSDVTQGWMNFSCPLELLLLSPTLTSQTPDVIQLKQCLQLLLAAMDFVPWQHLQSLESLGYYPLVDNWKEVLAGTMEEVWGVRAGPPSLSQLCRCVVKRTADKSTSGGLIGCVSELPIPRSIKQYLIIDQEQCS